MLDCPWSVELNDTEMMSGETAPDLLADTDPWAAAMPDPQPPPADLVAEGHTIPVARVQAMHEGKRRARDRRAT